jgi:hypothetical protein
MDSSHRVLENAQVFVIDSAHNMLEHSTFVVARTTRQARTNAQGVFRIVDLDPGTYRLAVRRIGYEIAIQSYVVTDSGGVARFCLFPDIESLPAIISSVSRGGITGVVGDTALALVKGADVRVLGENMMALTDSAGGFFFPAKPGAHTIAVKKKGYGPQVVGVTVPKDSGRKMVIWLGSPPRNPNAYANAIEGMRVNILMTPAFRYHRLTAEQLAESDLTLEQLVRVAGRTNVSDDCEAVIAGTTFSLPLYMLNKEDISLLEIVGAPLTRRRAVGQAGATSINGNAPIPTQGRGTAVSAVAGMHSPDCPGMTAWMKR